LNNLKCDLLVSKPLLTTSACTAYSEEEKAKAKKAKEKKVKEEKREREAAEAAARVATKAAEAKVAEQAAAAEGKAKAAAMAVAKAKAEAEAAAEVQMANRRAELEREEAARHADMIAEATVAATAATAARADASAARAETSASREAIERATRLLSDERSANEAAAIEAAIAANDRAAAEDRRSTSLLTAATHSLEAATARASRLAGDSETLRACSLEELRAIVGDIEQGGAVQLLNPELTVSLKAPGFNPRTHQARIWFQSLLCFQIQLLPLQRGRDRAREALRAAEARAAVGPLYKLNPLDPWLESAWFHQPLNLTCDILVSKLCFAFTNSTCTATPGRTNYSASPTATRAACASTAARTRRGCCTS
jgi:chemotaxis protein histidine kinase CheA